MGCGENRLIFYFGFLLLSVYNFDNNKQMEDLFSVDMKVDRIIAGIEIYAGHKIFAESTLLIFFEKELADKIQNYADNLGRDFSKQVRFMIKEYFEMKENK